jgi:hypothetical protein
LPKYWYRRVEASLVILKLMRKKLKAPRRTHNFRDHNTAFILQPPHAHLSYDPMMIMWKL